MSNELLDMGVFVIGFGYPVVPEGEPRSPEIAFRPLSKAPNGHLTSRNACA